MKYSLFFKICGIIGGACVTIILPVLSNSFSTIVYDSTRTDFQNWNYLVIEVASGIIITLIVYDKTKKSESIIKKALTDIEEREMFDLKLTLIGTYVNLFRLCTALNTFCHPTFPLESAKTLGPPTLSIINLIDMNLPKCGKKIKYETIIKLQLNVSLVYVHILSTLSPMTTVESLDSVKIRLGELCTQIMAFAVENFEPLLPKEFRSLNWNS